METNRRPKEDEEPWQQVIRRRRGKQLSTWRPTAYAHTEDTSTFFVSNLAEDCSIGDIWKEFRVFGLLSDVFVPKRKDRQGNRFAFIRYDEVKDNMKMVQVLNNVIMKGVRVRVNIAKFDRDGKPARHPVAANKPLVEGPTPQQDKLKKGPIPQQDKQKKPINMGGTYDGRPFQEVLSGGAGSSTKTLEFQHLNPKVFTRCEKFSLIGDVKDLVTLCNLHDILASFRLPLASVRYLGGLRILLSFSKKVQAEELLLNRSEDWKVWFTSLGWWEDKILGFERIAWIRITGVPLQLWDPVIFNKIGELYGEVIQKSAASSKDGNITCEIVGVLVKSGEQISDTIKVLWNGITVQVWISEDMLDWVPDCFIGGKKFSRKSFQEFENKITSESMDGLPERGDSGGHKELDENLEDEPVAKDQEAFGENTCMGKHDGTLEEENAAHMGNTNEEGQVEDNVMLDEVRMHVQADTWSGPPQQVDVNSVGPVFKTNWTPGNLEAQNLPYSFSAGTGVKYKQPSDLSGLGPHRETSGDYESLDLNSTPGTKRRRNSKSPSSHSSSHCRKRRHFKPRKTTEEDQVRSEAPEELIQKQMLGNDENCRVSPNQERDGETTDHTTTTEASTDPMKELEREVLNTMLVNDCVGIDLRGVQDQVRTLIQGEGGYNVSQ